MRVLPILLLVAACGGNNQNNDQQQFPSMLFSQPFATYQCEMPSAARVDRITLGRGGWGEDEFEPIADDTIPITMGPQGGVMVGTRLRLDTDAECLAVRASMAFAGGKSLGMLAVNTILKDGISGAFWFPEESLAEGQSLIFHAEVGGQQLTRTLRIH